MFEALPAIRTHRLSQGFTLVELLVVLVVIGILAAIAIPNFSGAQDRARNASVQNNLHILQQAVEQWGADIHQEYPDHLSGGLVGAGNDYLPKDSYPPSPWGGQQAAGTDLAYTGEVSGNVYPGTTGMVENPLVS
ncbi:MAG: prepilin-type N-terminal cleavage/methylation domain-containing protein, partial [Cyanobacteria bacterium REEB65]|nr:prepilin-type N-terminal cleavage/methylation domain-containing protein [Cyanobacteria bacterium REEB65]